MSDSSPVAIPTDESEKKGLTAGTGKASRDSQNSEKEVMMKEKRQVGNFDDDGPTEGQKISSFWTEIRAIPKSSAERWVIPYNLDKNQYFYQDLEIPKDISKVLDHVEFDRMMNQINSHSKIVSSSDKPHRKLIGVGIGALMIFFAEFYSDFIPEEALMAIVCLGFVLVILILNYIEEQKDSFGEVKRREISSILRQYECFTEKEVVVDFDVSDFGSFITVTRLLNTKKLAHVLKVNGQPTPDSAPNNGSTLEDSGEATGEQCVPHAREPMEPGFSFSDNPQDLFEQIEPNSAADQPVNANFGQQKIDVKQALTAVEGTPMAPIHKDEPVQPPESISDHAYFHDENGAEFKSRPENHAYSPIELGNIRLSKLDN